MTKGRIRAQVTTIVHVGFGVPRLPGFEASNQNAVLRNYEGIGKHVYCAAERSEAGTWTFTWPKSKAAETAGE